MAEAERELLAEQSAYYRAFAPGYVDGQLDAPGGDELLTALEAFPLAGDVLELACGPGTWTPTLLQRADSVTAVDGSPEMLTLAREHVGDAGHVRFLHADHFDWQPDRRYDVGFFGFWLSHVPPERFASFWALVDAALPADGRVFFLDDAYRSDDELIEGAHSSTIQRRLPDGRTYRAIKVPHTPEGLEKQLAELGWDITVCSTTGPFYWGHGQKATTP